MRAKLSVSTFVTDKLAAILIHRCTRDCYGCAEIRLRVVDVWVPVLGVVWVGPLVVKELKRIVEQSEIVKCV